MTLTFAYIDGRHTLHVADRRTSITDSTTGHSVPRDDDAVKIVAPRGSMLLSFTGAADLPHASNPLGDTALWLKDRLELVDSEVESGLDGLAAELNTVFAAPPYEKRKLTVTITGWAEVAQSGLRPWAACITNRDPETRDRLDQFHAEHTLVEPLHGGWIPTGVPLSDEAHARVDAAIQSAAPRSVGADVIANIFLHAIRRESTPTNGVSKSAVGVIYPLALAEHALASGQHDVSMTITNDGLIMRGACSTAFVPETAKYFEMINPTELDWSLAKIISL